jgi:N-acyl homoserine lactone hydrolase
MQDGDTAIFLAGDTSYSEGLMLAGRVDGVSTEEHISSATLAAIRNFTQDRPTIYLPTYDPASADRLANRTAIENLSMSN